MYQNFLVFDKAKVSKYFYSFMYVIILDLKKIYRSHTQMISIELRKKKTIFITRSYICIYIELAVFK